MRTPNVVFSSILLLSACASQQPPAAEPAPASSAAPASTAAKGVAPAKTDEAVNASAGRGLGALDLAPVYFGFDSDQLTAEGRKHLEAVADSLRAQAGDLVIEGHCDDRGTVEYNLALGERRAAVTRAYLVRLGVAAPRLRMVSYGENRPAAAGEDEDARAKNRRSELVPSGDLAGR